METQTAIQFLIENLNIQNFKDFAGIINQALEIEKKQITESYDVGFANGIDEGAYGEGLYYINGENYYNEVYGN